MRRKVLALFSALMMIISAVCPTQVFAENDAAMTMSFSENNIDNMPVGTEFTVTVYVSNFDNLGSIGAADFRLTYDSSKVEYVESAIVKSIGMPLLNNDTDVNAVKYSFMAIPSVNLGSDALYTAKFRTIAVGKADFAASVYSLTIDGESGNSASKVKTETSTLTIVNPCTGITLDKDTLTIARGETATLTATVEPADTTNTIVWSSENDNIATVENGVVTAVGLGETTITAACGDKTASCKVTVTKATIAGTANIYTKEGFFYGATLGASPLITNDGWETAKFTIKWYRDGEADSIATGDKYTLGEKDIGKQLYVIITADKYNGELKSKLTAVIEKATQDAPAKPEIKAEEKKIIVTNPNNNVEYRLGSTGKFDKKTTEFTVDYDKLYYVEARYPETATHKASAIVTSDKVTTPKAPCKLTVTVEGNGEVTRSPEGEVREGYEITLTATPKNNDHKFVEWKATGVTLTDVNKPTITFTMGSEDVTVKAVFAEKEAVHVGFGEDKTFTYNEKEQQAPTYGPIEQGDMKVEVKYFVRGGNMPIEKPTNVGKYTMQVTYTSSAASGFKTTVATCDFEIIKANQNEPDAPTVKDIKSDGFTVENFVTEQQYAIKTTNVTPEEAEWKNGSEFVNPVTGLKPATTYYVFTRKAGSKNYNPSPAVYATVTTAHTYEWEVDGSGVVGENVRVGGTLPESLKGTIKNIGTGTITYIKAALSGENVDNFKLDAVSTELASNGTLNIIVEPQGITTDNKGNYNVDVTVTADGVEDKIITFVINVVEKDPVIIKGIDDKTVTFNGKTQGIDLSKA